MGKKKFDKPDQPSLLTTADALGLAPPHNIEVEKNLLGSIMLDPMVCDDVVSIVHADDFYLEAHQILYEQWVQMYNQGHQVDIPLMIEKMRTEGMLEKVGGEEYLLDILHSVAVAAHAKTYAEVVREKSILRTLIKTATLILQDAYSTTLKADDLINQAEERIFAVKGDRVSGNSFDITTILEKTLAQIDNQIQTGGPTGIMTGLLDFDSMTGGLHNGELIILAARPSMGKTALATNFADYAAVEAGKGVLFVSLEMGQIELATRMICSRGRINGKKFRSSGISDEDTQRLLGAVGELNNKQLFIDDSPVRTVTEIAALGRRLKRMGKLDMIIIDYLQLITPDNPNDPRQEQVSKIARRLKGMARELEVPVVCLSQLNRQAEQTKDNRPRMSHLRESGAIEQDADVIMFVHREEYYLNPEDLEKQPEVKGKAEIIIAKQRNGPTGTVNLCWMAEYTRFDNLAGPQAHEDFSQFGGV